MESLLKYAYVEEYCNACGGHYRVTLQDALATRAVNNEWQPVRPCSVCAGEKPGVLAAIPDDALERISRAWAEIASAAEEAEIDLKLGE